MRGMRGVVALAAAALIAAVAAPAGAATSSGATNQSYRVTGQMAEGFWSTEGEDPGVGLPRNIAVMAALATETFREKGSKPTTQPMISLVAYSTTFVDPTTGDTYGAEVWAVATPADVTIASDLSSATLSFHTDEAVIVGWDPVTEQEVELGTMPLTVSVQWTGVGPLTSTKTHDKFTEDGVFSITNATETTRSATAEFTLTWDDGTHVDGVINDGMLRDVRAADFLHFWPEGL